MLRMRSGRYAPRVVRGLEIEPTDFVRLLSSTRRCLGMRKRVPSASWSNIRAASPLDIS
jgi:hypothetical protein